MRYTGNNYAINLGKNSRKGRRFFWGSAIQLRENSSRWVGRRNPPFTNMLTIISNPIRKPMEFLPEDFGWNIAERLSILHSTKWVKRQIRN